MKSVNPSKFDNFSINESDLDLSLFSSEHSSVCEMDLFKTPKQNPMDRSTTKNPSNAKFLRKRSFKGFGRELKEDRDTRKSVNFKHSFTLKSKMILFLFYIFPSSCFFGLIISHAKRHWSWETDWNKSFPGGINDNDVVVLTFSQWFPKSKDAAFAKEEKAHFKIKFGSS